MTRLSKILWISIFAYFLLTLTIGLSYHWGYLSTLTDLGTFDQAIWGTIQGDFFLNTNIFNQTTSYLGVHFRPILLIFIPFYMLLPNAAWMVIAQSFALSLTAWPIYLLSKSVSRSETAAFFWALAYMVNPFVFSVAPWVFRPESLVLPFIAIALLSIEKSNFPILVFSCLIVLLCKEHFGVMVIGFGLLWGLRNRQWKQGVMLIALGAVYSVLILGIVMPALSPVGKHVMLDEGHGQLSRYGWLGNSFREIFETILFHPIFVFKTAMLEMGWASYLLVHFILFLGFPLAAMEFLLPGLADLTANMLSANLLPQDTIDYHSMNLIPILTISAVYGTERISRWTKKFSAKELAGFAVLTGVIAGYYFSPLPLPGARNAWAPVNFLNLPDPTVHLIRSAVGDKASVSAQSNVGAHFSQRKEIYSYPNHVGKVDAVILRLESPTTNINILPDTEMYDLKDYPAMLDAHLQMDRLEYITSIENLINNKKYGILLWNDPWLVMKKDTVNQREQQAIKVKNKLNQLRNEWEIKLE